ncbi:hypothetical protein HDU91_000148 [Kappamyces sp. JEL0680]|nr:hypothetical protein HDU91_000148 [Kappamyces sp. JEL0680]
MAKKYPRQLQLRASSILDPGISQADAITVDSETTWANLELYHAEKLSQALADEADFLLANKPDLAFIDAPPFPALACQSANVPCVAVTNFTFDGILDYLYTSPAQKQMAVTFRKAYETCAGLIRLPGFIPMPAFDGSDPALSPPASRFLLDTDLVVRPVRTSRDQVRTSLGIPLNAKVLFINFGGMPMDSPKGYMDVANLLPDGWLAITIYPVPCEDASRFVQISGPTSYMPDIINASDVVLGKCGYGICAEIKASNIPLLYICRHGFAEELGLVELIGDLGVEMPVEAFKSCSWREWITKAYHKKPAKDVPLPPSQGASFVAEQLLTVADQRN